MSVDLYLGLPAANWPSAEQVQRCMIAHNYPIHVERFPQFEATKIVNDGALVILDGTKETYLEGEIISGTTDRSTVTDLNEQLKASGLRVSQSDAIMSMRTRSSGEMRAASYVIAGLIVCFEGFGFETQGNIGGRKEFAGLLVEGAEMLKGHE